MGDDGGAPPKPMQQVISSILTQPHSGKPRRRVEAGTCISAMQRRLGISGEMVPERASRAGSCIGLLSLLSSSSRVPRIARSDVVVVGWNFAGVSSPALPSSDTVSTWTPDWRIAGNDKGPFCHFCRAGDGRSLEFPFHAMASRKATKSFCSPRHETVRFSSQPGKQIEVECDENFEGCLPREVSLVNLDIICLIPFSPPRA